MKTFDLAKHWAEGYGKQYVWTLELLVDKIHHPEKYIFHVNVPAAFDAAEYLFEHHFSELKKNTQKCVEEILIKSGKYKKID